MNVDGALFLFGLDLPNPLSTKVPKTTEPALTRQNKEKYGPMNRILITWRLHPAKPSDRALP